LEWIPGQLHARIWNAPGGCIPAKHYLVVDWVVVSSWLFAVFSIGGSAFRRKTSK
jgi:hypothetical protein